MCFDTAGWLMRSSCAAAEKERRRANAAKARSRASSSITWHYTDRPLYVFQFWLPGSVVSHREGGKRSARAGTARAVPITKGASMGLRGRFEALFIAPILVFAISGCTSTTSAPAVQGKAGPISPSWSASAYRNQDRDDAWHFAYAVQSWAAEQSGHVVMIPARYSIVVDRAFFGEEFSHIPIRAFRGVRSDDPNQVMVLRHMWTTHAS